MHIRSLCRLLLLPVAAACADADRSDTGTSGTANAPAETVTFAPGLGVDPDAMTRTDSGVLLQDVRAGTGAVAERGRVAVIEYSAWLADGTLFEQRPNAEGFGPSELVIGEGMPRGLNEGIAGMRAGGVRRIVIPPAQGYGLVGRPAAVPAGSTLVFEVRLRSVR